MQTRPWTISCATSRLPFIDIKTGCVAKKTPVKVYYHNSLDTSVHAQSCTLYGTYVGRSGPLVPLELWVAGECSCQGACSGLIGFNWEGCFGLCNYQWGEGFADVWTCLCVFVWLCEWRWYLECERAITISAHDLDVYFTYRWRIRITVQWTLSNEFQPQSQFKNRPCCQIYG